MSSLIIRQRLSAVGIPNITCVYDMTNAFASPTHDSMLEKTAVALQQDARTVYDANEFIWQFMVHGIVVIPPSLDGEEAVSILWVAG